LFSIDNRCATSTNNGKISYLACADDQVLPSDTIKGMQDSLNFVSRALNCCGFSANVNKSMTFTWRALKKNIIFSKDQYHINNMGLRVLEVDD
jgi:hypothetical protein